ncbi:hypothetical protein [Paraburkholderia strydomiana]|uniref:hypothetical protein n=1 Tax=Paraburkholderia strydomiana TaxID=1245417 RepID=UPI001BE8CA3E|nr:hypothetical protein [Paraburkholderia strydomiana]MBT2792995.1 hypothetical protein [Paraburkholderia strydomiana]
MDMSSSAVADSRPSTLAFKVGGQQTMKGTVLPRFALRGRVGRRCRRVHGPLFVNALASLAVLFPYRSTVSRAGI